MQKFVSSLILIIFLFVTAVSHSFALDCIGPDAWYAIKVRIDSESLPEGVTIAVEYNDTFRQDHLFIKNTSDVPLFLFAYTHDRGSGYLRIPDSEISVAEEISENWTPFYQFVTSKAFELRSGQWLSVDDLLLPEGYPFIDSEYSYAHLFNIPLLQVYKDNRPALTVPPQSHTFRIPAYYGDQKMYLTGTLSYTLNTDYNPNQGKSCDELSQIWSKKYGGREQPLPKAASEPIEVNELPWYFRVAEFLWGWISTILGDVQAEPA